MVVVEGRPQGNGGRCRAGRLHWPRRCDSDSDADDSPHCGAAAQRSTSPGTPRGRGRGRGRGGVSGGILFSWVSNSIGPIGVPNLTQMHRMCFLGTTFRDGPFWMACRGRGSLEARIGDGTISFILLLAATLREIVGSAPSATPVQWNWRHSPVFQVPGCFA